MKLTWLTLMFVGVVCLAVGIGGQRGRLIWQDEFDSFNRRNWKHIVTGWRGGNGEFQYYDKHGENSYVRNGILYIKPTLTSRRYGENFLYNGVLDLNQRGCNLNLEGGCRVVAGQEIINPIQSARIVTEESFSFTYGTVEVKAKMPKGDWIWPAIWMLPTQRVYGDWPRSGEIDIVEVRGNADLKCGGQPVGRQLAGSALHWGTDFNQNRFHMTTWGKTIHNPDFSSAFHTYRLEWLPSGIKFYVDNQKYGEISPPAGGFWQFGKFGGHNIWQSGSKMAPFDKPFHFVLNVAVGGNFFEDGCQNKGYEKPWKKFSPTAMRQFWESRNKWLPTWNINTEDNAMQIDYIRVYKSG